jgi:pyruvate dehydrogenase E2 component (dihydrolipoamide acetyltransferase)
MPQLGLTMEEGTFVGFAVSVGSRIEPGEDLLEVETDKASSTVQATEAGYLRAVVAEVGKPYPVGAALGYLSDSPDEPLEV